MHRFFVEPEQIFPEYVEILGGDVNHIRNVLRMSPGDRISVSDGLGTDYICELEQLEAGCVRGRILERKPFDVELSSRLILYQGLPKGDKMELIVQKAVELGVCQVIPVETKRCVVKLDDEKAAKKVQRWQQIAESAAKQAGRGYIPKVSDVMPFPSALELAGELDVCLIPYELAEGMEYTRSVIEAIRPGQSVGIFIGPEGGFEREEVDLALASGAKALTLGKRILRTETAGLAVLSVLMYHLES